MGRATASRLCGTDGGSPAHLGGRYLHLEADTDEHGWLHAEYDDHRQEELLVEKVLWRGRRPTVETWLSWDRAEDRQSDGRPSLREDYPAELDHLDVDLDITGAGYESAQFGLARTRTPQR